MLRAEIPFNIYNLKNAIYSKIAQENEIDNFPGSDYNPIHVWSKKGTTTRGKNNILLKRSNIILNLHRLFKYCVNPITKHFGRQNIALTSVYRNKAVNKILGGVEESQHIYGYAADIILTNNNSTSNLFNWCKINIPEYHQLIWEYPERGVWSESSTNFSWIHISYIKGDNAKINSVSSTDPNIHKSYQDESTFYIDNFTHNISLANENVLIQ